MEERIDNDEAESSSRKVDDLFKNNTEKTLPKFHQVESGPDENHQTGQALSRQWYNPNFGANDGNSGTPKENSTKVPCPLSANTEKNDFNNFRFKFGSKYDAFIEEKLYPRFYHKFRIDGDFTIQRSGGHRVVCLICHCELLAQRGTHNIVSHLSGQKHLRKSSMPQTIKCLKNYHDVFCNLEPNMQAHQVYFMPDEDPVFVKCVLCSLYVKVHHIPLHIMHDPHKSHVTQLKNNTSAKNIFYLLDYHLDVYGIKLENSVEPNQKLPRNANLQAREVRNGVTNGYKKGMENQPHEIIYSVKNPKDPNPLKTLPRRFENHVEFLEQKGSTINCTVCKTGVSKNDILLHLIQSNHLGSTKLAWPNYLYFCEICDMKFHDEMTWHLHFEKGPNRHQTIAASRKDKVREHECLTCKVIIYGDTLSLRRHQNSFIRRTEKKKDIFLPDDVKKYFNNKNTINENGTKLLQVAQKIMGNRESVLKCCQDMENALSVTFPACKTYPFGSRVSGLGSEDSDLDLFLDIGRMYDGVHRQDDENQYNIIRSCLELFRKHKLFYKITSRPTARTPIIRLKHSPTQLDCDISFRHGLSVENTKFLRFCFELQPISQKLILLLKRWSSLCFLNENITTYAFAMMTIFYLQTENYLISVKKLRELNPQENVVIDGWDTIAYTTPMEKMKEYVKICDQNIVELLKSFFKYYSNFDYKTDVVCPLMGEIIRKSQFTDDIKGGRLPEEMKTYVNKINNDDYPEYFRALSEFCIQDPFDLSHNLTKACQPPVVEKFRILCKLSYEVLSKLG